MSFFEPPPPPPEPPEEHRQPEWIGPPENELGVALPVRRMLFRTDDLAIALLGIVVFGNGLELQVVLRRRAMTVEPDPMHTHMHARRIRGSELTPEVFRFGIEYPDGTKVTNVGFVFPFDGGEPAGPVLMERGGGGGGRSWSFNYWLWPLPPPGPLRVVVEWPAENVPLTDAELDGSAIAEAASRVEVLWPDDDRPGSDGAWARAR